MRLRHIAEASRLSVLRRWLLAEPLVWAPGERSEYSDVGFMLLQWIVETISGERLDRFVDREIYDSLGDPLGKEALFFNDAFRDASGSHVYAATQLCPWRNRLMVGQVDDDNAYVIGGVAGHAGLFGSADGVCRLLAVLLAADQGEDTSGVFAPDVVRSFFEAPENERWALGFDTPSEEGSSAGRYFPADSVGHLGFTGTSFWMHRAKGIIVVLFTNRVHPWRFNAGIKAFRPGLHDAVMRSVDSGELGTAG
jgi:CubicO group peptidase (beta-lactamase class C family)